ncbi:hypothetical protein C8Q76DRAFT_797300 [Earliella scabrosa]|nr:hypothetical protein C8Q76DRAFT_797300 [Earliella scabrosa]
MLPFCEIVAQLARLPTLYARIELAQITQFFASVERLEPLITLVAPRRTVGLPPLPVNVCEALSRILQLSLVDVADLWSVLGDLALAAIGHDQNDPQGAVDRALNPLCSVLSIGASGFAAVGLAIPIVDGLPGVEVVMPPVRTCIANGCPDQGKALGAQRNVFLGQLYTMRRGVVPVQIVTLSCRVCSTTYRPNYFIVSPSKQDATRTYYGGMPDAIEATESSFVDQDFARWTRAMMAFSHASGETIARVYNASLTPKEFPHPLAGRTVWHSFYIHALLLDCLRRQRPLLLPHHGPQASRYEAALDDRNAAMVGTGQLMWAHACKECEKLIPPGGDHEPYTRLSACVMDGISIGHARCNVDHCVERLRSPRDRFCPLHDPMHNICAMTGCDLPVTTG